MEEINKIENDDKDKVLVLLLRCETKQCDKNIEHLKWVFSDPYFIVRVQVVNKKIEVPDDKLEYDQYVENFYMYEMLKYASEGPYDKDIGQKTWNLLPVIIIKDSSICSLNPVDDENANGMKKRIKTALEKAKKADLFFLCKWGDSCDKYVDVEGTSLKWSKKPTATQAIMYTPSTRDYVLEKLLNTKTTLSELLNANIAREQLSATVFSPNIIDYDINVAVAQSDYAKLNQCDTKTQDNSVDDGTQMAWMIIIILIVIVVMWFVIQAAMNRRRS